jgi:hypothetical protein
MRFRSLAMPLIATLGIAMALHQLLDAPGSLTPIVRAHEPESEDEADLTTLKAEILRLKEIIAESSAMYSVDYHAQSLWFAGKAGNWPLADYYWKKTLSHMHLAVKINPVRKDNAGQEVRLKEILQSIESSPSMQVGQAIQNQDLTKFQATYRSLLEGCYACHRAVDKPFLRPRMPVPPAQSIINVDPKATLPR